MKLFNLSILAITFSFIGNANAQEIEDIYTDGKSIIGIVAPNKLILITDDGDKTKELNGPNSKTKRYDYAAIKGDTIIVHSEGLYLSTNLGTTWKELNRPPAGKFFEIENITINGSNIFLAVNKQLFYTSNLGLNWEKSTEIEEIKIKFLTYSGNTIYAGGQDKNLDIALFKSTDNGKTFEDFKKKPKGTSLGSISLKGTELIVSTSLGISAYNETEKSWKMLTSVEMTNKNGFRRSTVIGSNYLGYYIGNNLVVSNDNGVTWKTSNMDKIIGSQDEIMKFMNFNQIIFGLTYDGKLFLTKDFGTTWSKSKGQIELEENKLNQKQESDSLALSIKTTEANQPILKEYFKGNAELYYTNYESALEKLNKAIVSNSNFIEAYQARAKCYTGLKQMENAKNDSLTVIRLKNENKIDPVFAQNFKDMEAVIKDSSSLLHTECYYKDARGWYLAALNPKNTVDKLKMLNKSIELDGSKVEYFIARGDCHRDLYNEALAEADYNKAIEMNTKCEWYEHSMKKYSNCSECKGKGFKYGAISIKTQEVNGQESGTGDVEKITCNACTSGKIGSDIVVKSVRLKK